MLHIGFEITMHLTSRRVCLIIILLLPLGCGHHSELDRKVISGKVTCGGESVPRGFVRFVPIEGTHGPATSARIHDGEYRATNRSGVPFGKHRVEIIAQRPTGEKKEISPGEFIDVLEDIGDEKYAGPKSPVKVEVTADGDDQMDFDIP